MGFRQHLAEAILTPPATHEKRRDLLIGAAAMVIVAVACGFVARWLIRGGLSEGWDGLFEQRYGRYTAKAESLQYLAMGGGLVGLFALVLLLAALVTLLGALQRPGEDG